MSAPRPTSTQDVSNRMAPTSPHWELGQAFEGSPLARTPPRDAVGRRGPFGPEGRVTNLCAYGACWVAVTVAVSGSRVPINFVSN